MELADAVRRVLGSALIAIIILLFMVPPLASLVFFIRAFKCYTENRRMPILQHIKDGHLTTLVPDWPAKAERWPIPYSHGKSTMLLSRSAAYARVAANYARWCELVSQVLIVFGGAWLSTVLGNLWDDVVNYFKAVPGGGGWQPFQAFGWSGITHLSSLLPIAVGFFLIKRSQIYRKMESVYLKAAAKDEGAANLPKVVNLSLRQKIANRFRV